MPVVDLRTGAFGDELHERCVGLAHGGRQVRGSSAHAPVRLSRLVAVRFTGPDPQFSARVINSWTRLFIETSGAASPAAVSTGRAVSSS